MKTSVPQYEDAKVQALLDAFWAGNAAARIWGDACAQYGTPLVIDHITLRCMNIDRCAAPFLSRGYVDGDERIEYPDQGWWAKVYRRPGYPALFVDQAYDDARGEKSLIPDWVRRFGEDVLHHAAVRVPDIEAAIAGLEERGVGFSGRIVGQHGTRLRQIFTLAEVREGAAFSVLELTERNGYDGFYPEYADSLMQSSVKIKSS